jgi:hypothetical protein
MEPAEPFSPPPTPSRRGAGGTRVVPVQIAVVGVVVATAIALIVYFALRG